MTSMDLLRTLEDLTDEEFTVFKWHLKQPSIMGGYQALGESQLENTNLRNTVDLMVRTYEFDGALRATKNVLDKMCRKDLVQSLPDTNSEPEAESSSLGEELQTLRVDSAVPILREDLLKHSRKLVFDINTISREIELSNNNRTVTNMCRRQPYPDHPDRFDVRPPRLLCKNALTGRSYWEVEWTGRVDIAVSYRGIERTGDSVDREFGRNDQSWSLSSGEGYSVWHNNIETAIPSFFSSFSFSSSSKPSCYESVPHRVGVYVDRPAGTLSFYSVSSDTLILLHTFNTTFTEPLYPAFGLGFGEWFALDTLSLCPL